MYKKNQQFINAYKELTELDLNHSSSLLSTPTSPVYQHSNLGINDITQVTDPLSFKNKFKQALKVQASHNTIPYKPIDCVSFDENKALNEKRTVGYVSTVLLSNPFLRPPKF